MIPPRPVVTHWLRENAQERSPRRVLIVDTETLPVSSTDLDHHVLRLWSARLLRRREIDPGKPREQDWDGQTAEQLVDLVESLTRSDATLWLMTHNLNFDLAVTALPVLLTDRGWRITEGALTSDDPWCRLARKSRRLTITDSWSWLPAGVESIGQLIGLRKLPLPEWEDDDAAWTLRCRRDVAIIARAIGQLMDWWDAGLYGNWSITGPATGWSSYRHRKPRPHVLIDPDPVARELEARAVTGGRRQVFRVGALPAGLYADLDLATAHLTVMSECKLPMRRLRGFDSLAPDANALHSEALDVLAECEVETAAPRYPWDSGRGVFYPVGRFHTVLAGPEIRDALARGELVSIGRGYVYLMLHHMRDWARWLAGLLDSANPDTPPAVRLTAKHWSRCVPGKWAGHRSQVLRRTPDPRPGWSVERGYLAAEKRSADFLLIGGELWTIARDEWGDDAFPAILAWIQSHTRLAVGRLIDTLGPAALSVNTDGVLVDAELVRDRNRQLLGAVPRTPTAKLAELDRVCASWDRMLAPFSVRVKAASRSATVISPQHLLLEGERRLAGIPQRAVRLADGRFLFTQWPRLRVQLARPLPTGYQTLRRTVNLANVPPTGWLLPDGAVFPAQVWPGADGVERLTPFLAAIWTEDSLAPLDRQHPLLRAAQLEARQQIWPQEPPGSTERPDRQLVAP